MIRLLRYSLIVTALPVASLVQAQVNKCVDSNGRIVYSQAPCPANTKTSSVRQNVPANAAPSVASGGTGTNTTGTAKSTGPKTPAEMEMDFRKRRVEQEDARKKEQEKLTEAKGREDNCRSSRAQLAGLEAGGRQARMDDKGERYYLDDAQTASEIEKARKSVQDWCK